MALELSIGTYEWTDAFVDWHVKTRAQSSWMKVFIKENYNSSLFLMILKTAKIIHVISFTQIVEKLLFLVLTLSVIVYCYEAIEPKNWFDRPRLTSFFSSVLSSVFRPQSFSRWSGTTKDWIQRHHHHPQTNSLQELSQGLLSGNHVFYTWDIKSSFRRRFDDTSWLFLPSV